jgi:hypothetical protein
MMFFSDRETRALRARVKELSDELYATEESLGCWIQKAQTAEHRMSVMELHRSPDDLNKIVLGLAEEIENVFVRGGMSRQQRLNQVSAIVRRGIERALLGEKGWNT